MTATASGAGVELVYEQRGSGPAVVLVHGSVCGRAAWDELAAALGEGVRAVLYDRRGWGASTAPEPYERTTVEEQAEDAAALIDALGAAPALLCGDGLGAVVCLDLARRHSGLVRGAVLVEPPLAALSPRGSELVAELRDAIEDGARERGAAGAVDAYLDALDPSLARLLGSERVASARASVRPLLAELGAAHAWPYSRRTLREVGVPLRVLHGSRSHPVWREAALALAAIAPDARAVELDGGHALALERPADVAAALRELAA